MYKILLLTSLTLGAFSAVSQTGNFRTRVANGSWESPSSWQRDADGDGIYEESPSTLVPSASSGSIIIQAGHRITVNTSVSVDQMQILATGTLAFNASGNLHVHDGPGSDLINSGKIIVADQTQLIFENNCQFDHAQNGGNIPLSTWLPGSTCIISGITNTAPTLSINSAFQNFTWACAQQVTNIHLSGSLINISGDLNIENTNNSTLFLSNNTASNPVNIGGNLNVLNAARFAVTNGGTSTVNIAGDFNFMSQNALGSLLNARGLVTVNAHRFTMNAPLGLLSLSASSSPTVINLSGDFNLVAGTITETGPGQSGIFRFTGLSQEFINTGTIENVSYEIASGANLTLPDENALEGEAVYVSGTIRLGSLNSTGAIVTGTVSGNIRTISRIFSTGARVVYAGSGPQFIGNGHPAGTGVITDIDNSSGVTYNSTTTTGNSGSRDLTLGGELILSGGSFNVTSTGGVTRGVIFNGNIQRSDDNHVSFTGSHINTTINGTGDFEFPSGSSLSIRNFTINRSGGTVTINDELTVPGSINIATGNVLLNASATFNVVMLANNTSLSFPDQSISIRRFSSSGGHLISNANSDLTFLGDVANSTPLFFSPSGNVLRSLIINKNNTSGISVSVDSDLTITTELRMQRGQLLLSNQGLELSPEALLTVSSNASIAGESPIGGPWNVKYIDGNMTTGLEIPTDGIVNSLRLDTKPGTSLSLDQNLIVLNALTVPVGRSFLSGNNTVKAGSIDNAGIFSGPGLASGGLTVNGDLNNYGTLTNNSVITLGGNLLNSGVISGTGNFTFSGNTSIVGTLPSFSNITITGTFNAPYMLTLSGNLINNGVLNGVNTLLLNGNVKQTISGSTVTDFVNIQIDNTSSPVSVGIESSQNIFGTLTLAANAVLDADGESNVAQFKMRSTGEEAGQTARIAPLQGTSQIIGQVTVQRYLGAADDVNRFISSAVTSAPVSQVQDDFPVTGNFTGSNNGCNGCTQSGASLRYYQESIKGTFDQGYRPTPVQGGTNAEILVPGRGYSAYMWNGIADTVWDVTGPLNQGRIVFNVTHTPSNPVQIEADGWNLIGNPYPAAISWNNEAGWERDNIGSTVYVWDVRGGHWRTYDYTLNDENQDLASGIIGLGQAFWVYKLPGSSTMAINENAKAPADGKYYRKRSPESLASLNVVLSRGEISDKAFILIHDDESRNHLQAPKLEMGIENLSVSVVTDGQKKLVYHSVNREQMPETFLLSVSAIPGYYQFAVNAQGTASDLQEYFLVDTYLNKTSPLGSVYNFVVTENQFSAGNRFIITRNPAAFAGGNQERPIVSCYPNPVFGRLTVEVNTDGVNQMLLLNNMGQVLEEIPIKAGAISSGTIDLESRASGVYIVKVITSDMRVINSKVVKH